MAETVKFLSVDPGTHKTGVALFDGERLVNAWLLMAPSKEPSTERIERIIRGLEAIRYNLAYDAAAVACERVSGYEDKRPAPELQVLARRIQQWARQHRLTWHAYHPSTVIASVRPRGVKGMGTKGVIALGIQMLYGEEWVSHDQNLIDAVAVGHCHLSKQRERSSTGLSS